MMMIPEPWEQHTTMDERRRAFYEYHAAMLEPGTALPPSCSPMAARSAPRWTATACARPRYCITDDDLVIMGSGVWRAADPENKIVRKWRLQPGKMFLIDLEQGRMIDDDELKANIVNTKPHQAVDREPAHQARQH